jgi:hypothetical protein
MPLFQALAIEMMSQDDAFMLHVYDRTKATELWPLANADNVPVDDSTSQQYFVIAQFTRWHTSVSVIFCATSHYSHAEWQRKIASYLSRHHVTLKQHNLEALATTCIGFFCKEASPLHPF